MSKFRKGDIVSIRAVVKYDQDGDGEVFVRPDEYYTDLVLPVSAIIMHAQDIREGDCVRWDGIGQSHGTVLAINGGHAWIDLHNGDFCTRTFSSVERVEKTFEVGEVHD